MKHMKRGLAALALVCCGATVFASTGCSVAEPGAVAEPAAKIEVGVGQDCTFNTCDSTPDPLTCCEVGHTLNYFCRDLDDDRTNCGSCGVACAVNSVCSIGHCCNQFTPDWCSTGCKDLSSDVNNCGSCGYACPSCSPTPCVNGGNASCSAGQCNCACF